MFFNVMEDSGASNLTVEEEEIFGLQNAGPTVAIATNALLIIQFSETVLHHHFVPYLCWSDVGPIELESFSNLRIDALVSWK
jgi:hypothetical protein